MATMMDLDKDREVVKRTIKDKGPITKAVEDFMGKKSAMKRQQSEEGVTSRMGGMGSMKNVDAGTGRGTTTFGSNKTFNKQAIDQEINRFAEALKAGGKKSADKDLVDAHFNSISGDEGGQDVTPYVEAHDEATRFRKGGSVSSRADGCCQKGKTKGKWV